MTYERREEIFSKEILTIEDIQDLFTLGYGEAAKLIRNIKRKYDRLGTAGRLHVADYMRYFDIPVGARYLSKKPSEVDVIVAELLEDVRRDKK